MSRTYDILAQHYDWTWSITTSSVGCEGCDWSQELDLTQSARVAFRQHQADMIDSAPKAIEPKRFSHECEDWMIVHPVDKAPYCSGCGSYVA
jgi:hypothetical protein